MHVTSKPHGKDAKAMNNERRIRVSGVESYPCRREAKVTTKETVTQHITVGSSQNRHHHHT